MLLAACGQPGPLYLPRAKPAVDVQPSAKAEVKQEDKNPEPPPKPENAKPIQE